MKKKYRIYYYTEVEVADDAKEADIKAAIKDEVQNHVIFKAVSEDGIDVIDVSPR